MLKLIVLLFLEVLNFLQQLIIWTKKQTETEIQQTLN